MRVWTKIALTATLAVGAALPATASVSAMPFGLADKGTELAARLVDSSALIEARYHRGRGVGAGFATGLLLGGIIGAQPRYYGEYPTYPYYPYYPNYPYYSPAYPAYGPYSPGDHAIAYCLRRFRSYDPYSMSYLGFDGYRHPCP